MTSQQGDFTPSAMKWRPYNRGDLSTRGLQGHAFYNEMATSQQGDYKVTPSAMKWRSYNRGHLSTGGINSHVLIRPPFVQ